MHVENFKVFVDLVETGSFSKAAKINGITQSAVSQQLRSMERHFDVLIVDRSQKQLFLTPEGRHLFESAKGLLHTYERLRSELLEMREVVGGTLSIETIYSVGLHELPPLLTPFKRDYPDVKVRVEFRKAAQIYEDVLQNNADCGMVAFPTKHPLIEVIPFKNDRMAVICSPQHPFARRKVVSLEEVARERLIAFTSDIPTRKATDAIFRKARLNPEPAMEFDNIETVKRAVEIDSGVGIVPEATIRQETVQKTLVCVPISGRKLLRPLALIHRKGRLLTPAMRQFIQHVAGAGRS